MAPVPRGPRPRRRRSAARRLPRDRHARRAARARPLAVATSSRASPCAPATGEELGRIVELYRAGGAEVFVVRGPRGELDVPGVHGHRDRARARAGRDDRRPRGARRSTRARRGRGLRPAARPPAAQPTPSERAGPPAPTANAPRPDRARRRRAVRAARVVTLEVDVLTLFPAMVEGPLRESIPARILERGLATVRVHDLRRVGPRQAPDGRRLHLRRRRRHGPPAGARRGGARRAPPPGLDRDPARSRGRGLPPGDGARRWRRAAHLVFLCPRYEGVDERIRAMVDLELSIGDYVLTGGELAALVVVDAVLRLLPGAIDEASTAEESFAAGLLEYPQYTRPATFDGVLGAAGARLGPPRGGPPLAAPRVAPPHAAAATGPAHGRPLSPEERRLLDEIRAEPTSARRDRVRAGGRVRRRLTRGHRPCYPPPSAAPSSGTPSLDLLAPRSRGCRPTAQGPVPVNVLNEIVQDQLRTDLPEITPGDTVKVAAKVVEGNRERIQVFEGLVMRMRNSGHRVDDHRPPDRLGRRRRAHVQAPQPADRPHRGRPPRPGPPREAVLPAQPRGQGRDHAPRAPLGAPADGPAARTPSRDPTTPARPGVAPCPAPSRRYASVRWP